MAIVIVPLLVSIIAFFLTLFLVFYVRRRRSTDIFRRLRRHLPDIPKYEENTDFLAQLYRLLKRLAKPMTNVNFAGFLDLRLRQASSSSSPPSARGSAAALCIC